ncbi:MAG: head GIN domain-containing protein [Agriterribacter sp.]
MDRIIHLLSFPFLFIATALSAQTKNVSDFNKIIVSPYIQATLVQGNEESVTINSIEGDSNKLHIQVNDHTLRLYLDGAKNFPKKDYSKSYEEKHAVYNKTIVKVTITYKMLEALSLRGEENHVCKSAINGNAFSLHVYGEPSIVLDEINVNDLRTTLYGEGKVEIKGGTVKRQKYTCYGKGKIDALAIQNNTAIITSYGNADCKLNVSDRIKITAFGDVTLDYTGDASIYKGIHFGDITINKIN